MKQFVLTLAILALALWSETSFADCLIELKTGGKFASKHCWEEDGQIKFYRYGGIVGVQKDLVDKIEMVDTSPEEEVDKGAEPPPEEKKPVSSAGKETKVDGSLERKLPKTPDKPATARDDSPEEGPDLEAYRTEYLDLKARHKEANNRYWKARRAKDYETKEAALAEIKELAREIESLKNQVKEENNGALPEWCK